MDKGVPYDQEDEEGSTEELIAMERTLVLIKPDGVKRRLVGRIFQRFEEKGLRIAALKLMNVSRPMAEEHYSVHRDKPFFRSLVDYITSGPVVAAVLEGSNAIAVVRKMCGATDGSKAEPGTIRGDFSMGIEKNIIHASDSHEAYEHEYRIFFRDEEILNYECGDEHIIY